MMRLGIAAADGGFVLKGEVAASLRGAGREIEDCGAHHHLTSGDDYPDFIVPSARAVAAGQTTPGATLCGSGVGASIAAEAAATLV